MLCIKCGSDDHSEPQYDDAKSSYDSIRSGIRQSQQRGVPAIHLLTAIVNSLEEGH